MDGSSDDKLTDVCEFFQRKLVKFSSNDYKIMKLVTLLIDDVNIKRKDTSNNSLSKYNEKNIETTT
jgi:hypothetical protein